MNEAGSMGEPMGCGNPLALIDLIPGEKVLGLGYGGGLDVLAAAQRVGPDGFVTGVDSSAQMVELARRNAAEAEVDNVEFVQAEPGRLPLADDSVDAVLSSCVIDLGVPTRESFAEMARVLRPGGALGIADVVADDALSAQERADLGRHLACTAGPMSKTEYLDHLTAAGFTGGEITLTHGVADGVHGAMITAHLA